MKRIAILGAGKMGSWLCRELGRENSVAAYDMDRGKAAQVENAKVLEKLSDLEDFKPEMLINAVSLQNTVQAFEQAAQHLQKSCIICDVASVKGKIPDYYQKCGFRFASMHPMFGPTFADMGSLKDENAVIIRESDPDAADFFRKFFAKQGVKVYQYSFKEHDEVMAYSLTTPFVSSLVFAACVDNAAVPGATFARHMKISRGLLAEDNDLLCEVLFNPQSLSQLDRITSRLELLKHIIKARDYEEANDFLDKLRKNVG